LISAPETKLMYKCLAPKYREFDLRKIKQKVYFLQNLHLWACVRFKVICYWNAL